MRWRCSARARRGPTGRVDLTRGPNSPAGGELPSGAVDHPVLQVSIARVQSGGVVSAIKFTAGGTATATTEIDSVQLWLDADNSGTVSTGDTRLGQARAAATVTFSGLSLSPGAGTPIYVLVTAKTKGPTSRIIGRTYSQKIASVSDVTSTNDPPTFGTPAPTGDEFMFWGLTVALGGSSPAADTIQAGSAHLKSLFQLQLTAFGAEAINVTSVNLNKQGTATTATLDSVELYVDFNDDGILNGPDENPIQDRLIGLYKVAGTNFTAGFTISAGDLQVPAGSSVNVIGVVKTKTNSTNGQSVALRVLAGGASGNGVTTDSVRVSQGTATGRTFTVYAAGQPGVLNVDVGDFPPVAGPLPASTDNITILHVKLTATGEDIVLSNVRLTRTGTVTIGGATAQVDQVHLWWDKNDDGAVDGGDALVRTTTYTDSAAVSNLYFDDISSEAVTVPNGGYTHLLVLVRRTAVGTPGNTLTLAVSTNGHIKGVGATYSTTISSVGIATSNTFKITRLNVTLGANTRSSAALTDAATDFVVGQFRLEALGEEIDVTQVILTLGGTTTKGTGNEITQVKLWNDTNGNGVWDTGEPQVGSTLTAVQGSNTFTGISGFQVPETLDGYAYLLVTVNTGTGVATHTLTASIAATGRITGTGARTSAAVSSLGTATSSTMYFPAGQNTLAVDYGGNNPAENSSVLPNETVPMLQLFMLGPSNKAATVNTIVLTCGGTVEQHDISEVRLHTDLNENGVYEDGEPQIGTTGTWTGTTITFGTLNYSVPQNSVRYVLAVAKTSVNARSGKTFSLRVQNAADITTDVNTLTYGTTPPLTSQTMTVKTGEIIVTKEAEYGGTIGPNSRNVPLMLLKVRVDGGSVALTSIKVANTFGATNPPNYYATDIDSLEIYRDNGNLTFDLALDTLYAQTEVSGSNGGFGTGTFIAADTVRSNAPGYFFVVYDIAAGADPAHSYGARIAAHTDIGASIGTVLSDTTGPNGDVPLFPIQLDTERSLPVEFASFTAEAVGQAVKLMWATESETDNLYWIVERKEASAADATYVQIHRLDGMGSTPFRTDYEFVDRGVVPGMRYAYRLTDVSRYGVRKTHDPVEVTAGGALQLSLGSAYPNPANPATVWAYSLPSEQSVRLAVYNTLGQQVRVLVNGRVAAGTHQARWDVTDDNGRAMASGVYFAVMETPTSRLVSRVTVLR